MPIRILLADDYQLVRQGLKLLLEREGFKVTAEAENGHEAVKLAQELRPDVVLIYIAMPLLNGLDALHEIQKVSPKTKRSFSPCIPRAITFCRAFGPAPKGSS